MLVRSIELYLQQFFPFVCRHDVQVLHRGLDFAVAEELVEADEVAAAAQPIHGEKR